MQTQQTPQVLQQPFAAQGDKNTIPNAATGTNKASLQEGFPPITGQPINQGGIPPERQDFNGAMNLNSQFYFAFQNGWLPTFSQEVSDAIGGYPQGAVLWYQSSEGLQILESAIPDNTNNFITNPSVIGTSWISVAATAGDIALKADTDLSNCTQATQATINNIMPANMDYVVETYQNGNNWYRKYKSGWIEQGGKVHIPNGNNTGVDFSFLKAMANTSYNISAVSISVPFGGIDGSCSVGVKNGSLSTTGCTMISATRNTGVNEADVLWRVSGKEHNYV